MFYEVGLKMGNVWASFGISFARIGVEKDEKFNLVKLFFPFSLL